MRTPKIAAAAILAAATVSALLALTVALRRRATGPAFGLAALVGLGQAALGFRPGGGAAVRALQPTVTDVAIVVLLGTLAARRPRRESVAGLALCLIGAGIAIDGWSCAHRSAILLVLATGLFISPKVVEKHVASIFDKLGLAPSDGDNRRVLAAIRYLGS
jgi:hypothetical protein